MKQFCQQLPKIELHAHLNGSLSKSTLINLGCLEKDMIDYQPTSTNMNECFKFFKVAHKATNNTKSLYVAAKSVIQEFLEDNVIYLELRTTPREEQEMTEKEYIQTIVEAIKSNQNTNIMVKLLLSLDRTRTFQQQEKTLENIIEYKKLYPEIIKGIDLSGNPLKGCFYESLFKIARQNGLLTAIHCGEIKNDEEVQKMLTFKPDRIGHATFLHPNYGGSGSLWSIYNNLKIPAEICLTSNVVCGIPKTYKEHHVQEWIKELLPFCINTDDKGVFNTTLSNEFWLAHENYSLSKEELWNISYKSVDYTFASSEEKQCLRENLKKWNQLHLLTTNVS